MKSEIKKLDTTKREIHVEVTGEVVHKKFEDVFKRIAKEAKIPGFRVGNAPRDLVEKNYSDHAHELVLKELIPDIYDQVIAKESLDVIELPQITDVKLDRGNLSFKATVEVRPEIKLKDYKGLKAEYKKVELGADEVKKQIETFKEKMKLEAVDDNLAKALCYPNLAELEKSIERQILVQKETQMRQKIENDLVDDLVNGTDFKLPQSLVDRQLQDNLRQTKLDLAMKGVPREELDKHEKELIKDLEPQAKKQVQVYLILAEVAKKEKIALDDQMPRKVIELLLKEADWKQS